MEAWKGSTAGSSPDAASSFISGEDFSVARPDLGRGGGWRCPTCMAAAPGDLQRAAVNLLETVTLKVSAREFSFTISRSPVTLEY